MKKKSLNSAYIPLGFCPHCKEEMPIEIDTMTHKKLGIKLKIAHCPKCDAVLNLDGDFKIRHVTEKEISAMGWKKEK